MSIQSLKKRAVRNPEVRAEYEKLHDKFVDIERRLRAQCQAHLEQKSALRSESDKNDK